MQFYNNPEAIKIINICKKLGCCDACCLRYVGIRSPNAYENPRLFLEKIQKSVRNSKNKPPLTLQDDPKLDIDPNKPPIDGDNKSSPAQNEKDNQTESDKTEQNSNKEAAEEPEASEDTQNSKISEQEKITNNDEIPEKDPKGDTNNAVDEDDCPQAKKRKLDICVCCLGILQEQYWGDATDKVKEVLEKKRYACESFACALSSPCASLLRDHQLSALCPPRSDAHCGVTPLKEAWKWSFGVALSRQLGLRLESGAVSPLLITLSFEYDDDVQELKPLKCVSPGGVVTRRAVETALRQWQASDPPAAPTAPHRPARCVSVTAAHAPIYIGGRYVKLSRSLPQTPWWVNGRRALPSSLQDELLSCLAAAYSVSKPHADRDMKFMAAGREDVDVRCLGDGRPFAVEINDPERELSREELAAVCADINKSGSVLVRELLPVTKEDLAQLKCGEESKSKTYRALVVKLQVHRDSAGGVVRVSPAVISAAEVSALRAERLALQQRTPLRVLHRRAAATRTRHLLHLHARTVPGHPCLLVLDLKTEAGTYVKEFIHGECGRTKPSLADVLKENLKEMKNNSNANETRNGESDNKEMEVENDVEEHANSINEEPEIRFDILALDVVGVHLEWPVVKK